MNIVRCGSDDLPSMESQLVIDWIQSKQQFKHGDIPVKLWQLQRVVDERRKLQAAADCKFGTDVVFVDAWFSLITSVWVATSGPRLRLFTVPYVFAAPHLITGDELLWRMYCHKEPLQDPLSDWHELQLSLTDEACRFMRAAWAAGQGCRMFNWASGSSGSNLQGASI